MNEAIEEAEACATRSMPRWASPVSISIPMPPGGTFLGLEGSPAMSVFTDEEREYLSSGVRLGRLATVGSDGTPHVVPTAFRYNPDHDTIDIGGHDFAKRKKYRDVLRNPKVAFVVDDIASVNPWRVRGIEIRGEAEVLDTGGTELMRGFAPEMFRITPTRIVSWGLAEQMSYKGRSVP
jgi:pyridoxamine 5'-phosphate oxidase family protein